MSEKAQSKRNPGRPMSTAAGYRILDAVIDLLGERGWEGLSIELLASRARVGKATIYRRWSSKEDVVIAALERFVERIRLHDTGSLRTDLVALMTDAARAHNSAQARLLPALASAMERHSGLAKAVRRGFLEPRRLAVKSVLERAQERGELAADADLDLIHDMLAGPLLYRRLMTHKRLDRNLIEGLVGAVVSSFERSTGRAAT